MILICCVQSVTFSAPEAVRSAVRRGGATGAAAAGSASPDAGGTPTAPSDRFVHGEMANLFELTAGTKRFRLLNICT